MGPADHAAKYTYFGLEQSEEQHADDDANEGSRRTKRSRTAGRKRRRKKQYEERLQDELRDCKSPACSDRENEPASNFTVVFLFEEGVIIDALSACDGVS